MTFIRNIIGFIFAAALIAFAVFNRQDVEFSYSPFHDPIHMPLYLIALCLMAIGFLLGGITVWLNMADTRRLKRMQRKKIKELEKELQKTELKPADTEKPPSDFFPALPHKSS